MRASERTVFAGGAISATVMAPQYAPGWCTGIRRSDDRGSDLFELLDLEDVVRAHAVCLPVHREGGFPGRRHHQPKDSSASAVVPVFDIADSILLPHRHVARVVFGCLGR